MATQYLATEIATIVHESVKEATVDTLVSTVVHSNLIISGTVADITGTVDNPATWDATTLGLSTGSTSFQWEWGTLPVGSSLTSGSFQLPNSGSTTILNMSGNTGLWHLDSTASTPTQIGSVGLIDTYGDGWHGNNFVNVSVNGANVLSNITLAAGAGPEWYDFAALDGDLVEVTFTPGSFPTECKYDLNDAPGGTGGTFYNSPTNPATPYPFTANGFSSGSIITAPDSSGNDYSADVDGTTLSSNTRVGDYAFNFNGSSDFLSLAKPSALGIDGGNSRTISFWASASAWVDYTTVFSMGTNTTNQDFSFLQNAPNSLRLSNWSGGSDLVVTAGSTSGWNHYFIIYDSSDATSYIYQNNTLLGSKPGVSQNTSDLYNLQIGAGVGGWTGTPKFSGSINEFAIFDRALSEIDRSNIYFLQSGSCASGSYSGSVGLGDEFTFTPDVSGTFETILTVSDGYESYDISGSVFAFITDVPTPPGPTPIISGSNPTVSLIEANNTGYVINTYRIQNLSVQRSRTTEQVPFKIGTKGRQSLRLRTNTEFTGSS